METTPRISKCLQSACRSVVETFYGEDGRWLCAAYDAINAAYFEGWLPFPLLTIEITHDSACLVWCSADPGRPPHIAIHPTVFGPRRKVNPWGVPEGWLGRAFAFDVLL